jgi:two-component system chemotaxis response regulator CheB
MPGAIANAGRASAVLPPDEIGRLVAGRGGGA